MSAAPNLKLVPDLPDINAAVSDATALELADITRALEQTPPPVDLYHYNDLENAERFVEAVDGKLLYVPETDKWLYWNGTHWTGSGEQDHAFELICAFVKKLLITDTSSKEARQNAKRANDTPGISAIERLSKRKLVTPLHEFDRDPLLLNCKSGTINLKTGAILPHDRTHRITQYIDHEYDTDREPTRFLAFLTDIQPDPSVRAFIQRSIGYTLLGNARERAFWILSGGGRNGKSIFIDCFSRLLGGYASNINSATLMQKDQSSIPNDLARLRGKRFIVTPETEENERINASVIKAMAAGDKMTARFLFKEFFDFEFSGKLWIATNHRPQITDHSDGFWDRLKLIPFNTRIDPGVEIKRDTLLAELAAEYPSILAWAVQGCRDYFGADRLDVPDVIQREIDAYRHEQDSIAQFIQERCQTLEQFNEIRSSLPEERRPTYVKTDFEISNAALYESYGKFCKANGEYQRSQKRLAQNLRERGFNQGRNRHERFWEGLRLLDSE